MSTQLFGTALIAELQEKLIRYESERVRRINEQTDVGECYLSVGSEGLSRSEAETQIKILKNGGVWDFDVLRDSESGEIVSQTQFNGKFGPCWIIEDLAEAKFGKFVGVAKKEATYNKKGLSSGKATLTAWAKVDFKQSSFGWVKIYSAKLNRATGEYV